MEDILTFISAPLIIVAGLGIVVFGVLFIGAFVLLTVGGSAAGFGKLIKDSSPVKWAFVALWFSLSAALYYYFFEYVKDGIEAVWTYYLFAQLGVTIATHLLHDKAKKHLEYHYHRQAVMEGRIAVQRDVEFVPTHLKAQIQKDADLMKMRATVFGPTEDVSHRADRLLRWTFWGGLFLLWLAYQFVSSEYLLSGVIIAILINGALYIRCKSLSTKLSRLKDEHGDQWVYEYKDAGFEYMLRASQYGGFEIIRHYNNGPGACGDPYDDGAYY